MSIHPAKPDRMFDRTWRPGHPFRPRLSAARRWGMFALFLLLLVIIGAYWTLTDSRRVKGMAETYLSQLVGGRVEVKHATLSIFEGLRLDGVKVYADAAGGPGGGERDDSLVFSAATFLIKYNPDSILSGRLKATEIVAIDPQLHLCEELSTGQWNFQRLSRAKAAGKGGALTIPRIFLRNGTVVRSQSQDGRMVAGATGRAYLEGSFAPSAGDPALCEFRLQTRGESSALNADLSGTFQPSNGRTSARISGLTLGSDVVAMLPRLPRQWCESHSLAGSVNIPVFYLSAAADPHSAPQFRLVMEPNRVTMAILPSEMMFGDDADRMHTTQKAMDILRLAGINDHSSGFTPWEGRDPSSSIVPASGPAHEAAPKPALNIPTSGAGAGLADCLESIFLPILHLDHVTGQFVFTPDKIEINHLHGDLEGNGFDVDGHIDGYHPAAAAELRLQGNNIDLPDMPQYVASLPKPARELFIHLRPHGKGSVWATYSRANAEQRPRVEGAVNVVDGSFCFDRFPYPLHHASGVIRFGPDAGHPGEARCDIVAMRGMGIAGGPNEKHEISVDCSIAPLKNAEMHVSVHGHDIVSEPALIQAMPPEARQALALFDPEGAGRMRFEGDFDCNVYRHYGKLQPITFDLVLALHDAQGAFKPFPYALEQVRGKLHITGDRVEIIDITARHPGPAGANTTVGINGVVKFGRSVASGGIDPELSITAAGLPIEGDFLAALPRSARLRLEGLGAAGVIDISGKVFRMPDAAGVPVARGAPVQDSDDESTLEAGIPLGMDFHLSIDKGRLSPANQAPAASDATRPTTPASSPASKPNPRFALTGIHGAVDLAIRPTSMSINWQQMLARRGDAEITGSGSMLWPTEPGRDENFDRASATFDLAARNLLLDGPLYALLPPDAREAWDNVQPSGTVDVELHAAFNGDQRIAAAGAATQSTPFAQALKPSTNPAHALAATMPAGSFDLMLHPRQLTATVKAVPYRLDGVTGTIHIDAHSTTLSDITAHHGAGKIFINGTGVMNATAAEAGAKENAATAPAGAAKAAGGSRWDLRISARDLPADADLHRSLPAGFSKLLDTLKLQGKVSFDLSKISYTPSAAGDGDLALEGKLWLQDASFDIGMPISRFNGVFELNANTRAGKLADLKGTIDAPKLNLGGRDLTNFHAEMFKPADRQAMRFDKLGVQVLGGDLAGKIELAFPDNGPSRYALDLQMRNADVQQLDPDKNIRGALNLSLALEGAWDDTASRRGRGDVLVTGHDLYQIPLMMGLLQMTNLSLPISSPFNEATARYNVDGQKVTFETIALKAKNMIMKGSGILDYGSKKVSLTFTTDNPNAFKIPLIDPLLTGVHNELLTIHVSGSVESPKVNASMMDTITTTVDQVTKGK